MRKLVLSLLGLILIATQAMAQGRQISGRVTDEKGNVLPNASVVVKGTTIGATTEANGRFSLSVPSNARILVVCFIGQG